LVRTIEGAATHEIRNYDKAAPRSDPPAVTTEPHIGVADTATVRNSPGKRDGCACGDNFWNCNGANHWASRINSARATHRISRICATGVRARSRINDIRGGATGKSVVSTTPNEKVRSIVSVDTIIAGIAGDAIVAKATAHDIIALAAGHIVATNSSVNDVISVSRSNDIIAVAGKHCVVAITSEDAVGSGRTADDVVTTTCADQLSSRSSGDDDIISSGAHHGWSR
jgi:hypothetical protein